MARYIFQGTFRDGQGNIIPDGTVTVFDACTTTASTLYAASSGGTSVNSVTSDDNGFFCFYIDSSDYSENSKFDITLSKSGYSDKTYEDVVIYGKGADGADGATGPAGPTGADGAKITSVAWSTNDMVFTLDDSSTITLADAKTDLTGPAGTEGSISQTFNLSPRVNATVNILDIFTKAGGAVPDNTNYFSIAIPDGTGYTDRTRKAAYLSGESTITMADAAGYWSKGSLDAEIKTAWLYAIWDGTGIVWALAGYSGFNMVTTTTTVTDDDFFLLETSSTYSRSASHYCVAVAKIRYQYDTADAPDHTIQATVENAPQVIWNPKSDYGKSSTLASSTGGAADITIYSCVSAVVKQAGMYEASGHAMGFDTVGNTVVAATIRSGSATFGSATERRYAQNSSASAPSYITSTVPPVRFYCNSGDTIHLGAGVNGGVGTRTIYGDNTLKGATGLTFRRVD